MPILGYTRGRGVFTACPLLPLLRGYHGGYRPLGPGPQMGVHPFCGGCVDHTLTRGQTCYLTTPSLYAYLRLYKREGCIYCMSSFEHISGGVAPCVGGGLRTLRPGVGVSGPWVWGGQTPDLGGLDPPGGHPRGPLNGPFLDPFLAPFWPCSGGCGGPWYPVSIGNAL